MGSMAISATGGDTSELIEKGEEKQRENRLKKVRKSSGENGLKKVRKSSKKAEKNLLKNLRNSTIFHTFAYEKTYPTRDAFL